MSPITSLFKKPSIPEGPKPVVMPDENDPAVLAARRREMMIAQARSGRMSTMLSDTYDRDKTGAR